MQVHEKAAASFLLLAIVGAIALSLAAVRPAAAQDGQRSDGNDFVQEQRALSRPLFSSPPRYIQDGVQAIDTPNVENEIVYIDDQGFIRIFDPQTPPDMPPLNFRSPEGDGPWYDAAVDDLNGDGDDEIVAIAEDGVVTIYDPVVNLVITNTVQEYDGVYWELLFTTQVAGEPLLVTTGEFDDNPATREIVVVFADPDNANATRIQIFVQPAAPFDGRTWIPLTDVRFGAIATAITSGDLDGDGRDDLAVVASGVGRLSILRRDVNNVLSTYWSSISDSRPWTDAAIGQVATDSALPELAAVRSAAPPLASLVVQRYIPVDEFEDVLLRDHLPAPRQVILANVTGASTQQIFMLRNVPSNDTRPRLFNSRTGSGANLIFEVRLDSDNGYRVAAAGDLDGDGKDEIAVLRDSGILIFTEPASSTTLTQTLTAPTNQRTLVLGNLDALGRDLLSSTPSSLSFVVPAGERSAAQTITLSNRTRTNQIPYTVGVAPAVRFVAATPAAGATRAEIAVSVDATDLLPLSMAGVVDPRLLVQPAEAATPTYGANLIVTSADPLVLNSPLTIPVIVTVTQGIIMRPNNVMVVLEATAASLDCRASLPLTTEVSILGTLGSTFNIGSGASWLTVVPSQKVIAADTTAVLTLTTDAATTPLPFAETEVILNAVVPDGANNIPMTRQIPVKVACFQYVLRLPIVLR